MATKNVTLEEADGHLSELLELVAKGDEIVITKDNRLKAKLISLSATSRIRAFGQYKGKIHIHKDFDQSLPDSFWLGGDRA